ncbi:extracellular solute-binding protein [Bifidobacterium sp.]|jgi:multiple sugar transport system substrate-binding protein|uniref:extracellular solute-binding protein n=1 Tax=Bifidobacterium sp. TaxID=41200 RepID=UPI0025BF45A8|nr:extracellular solute-binding protein [Bifidobacterium sp.]MCH4208872.1 extracellular solute-binding protein [Bifidobacterium sp.]MCI1224419.1 extracellular solute-binding protein [Bifidobacterium sp.]
MRHSISKTTLALVASVAMLAGVAGCGRTNSGSSASADEMITMDSGKATGDLTVWAMGNEGDQLGGFVKGFEQENPDVKLKVTAIPWASAHDKIQTAIAAGTVPDVIQMGTTWMADFSNSFSRVPENFDLTDFSEGPLAAGKVDGVQFGVPWYVDSHVLYYRTDIAAKAGWTKAPRTLDELKQMATDTKKVDGVKNGLFIASSGADTWQGTLWAYYSQGVKLMDAADDNWTLDTPEMKKATAYIDAFFKDGITSTTLDATPGLPIAQFVSGETPIMTGGPTAISQIAEQGADVPYATAMIPKGTSSTSFVGGADFVVPTESKNKQAAWKFIRWMTEPNTQIDWFEQASVLPSSQQAWSSKTLSGDEKLKAYGEQLKSTMSPPSVSTWAQVSAAGDQIMEQIHKGQLSVNDGLKKLQTEADSIGTGK